MRLTRDLQRQWNTGRRVGGVAVLTSIVCMGYAWQRQQDPNQYTRSQMRDVRAAIWDFQQQKSRLPETLQEICPDPADCPLTRHGSELSPLRDGWGEMLRYRTDGSEYELRSVGPDRTSETLDDIVFSSSEEQALMLSVAGCYLTDLTWWTEFPGHQVVLDTATVGRGGLGYRMAPVPKGYLDGIWRLEAGERIVLDWAQEHAGARIDFEQVGDSLRGMADIPGYGPKEVLARRTECPRRL